MKTPRARWLAATVVLILGIAAGAGAQERPIDPVETPINPGEIEDLPTNGHDIPVPVQCKRPPSPDWYEYAVKLVCGQMVSQDGRETFLPGSYRTAINVHNPSTCETARLRQKVAVAEPHRRPGAVSRFISAVLRPDDAMAITCEDLAKQVGVNNVPDGFAVIQSPVELDVVAVYTAGPSTVQSIHTERVQARRFKTCTDLNLNLSTGSANPGAWTLTSGPSGTPGTPAQTVTNPPANWTKPPGAEWVSHAANGAGLPGTYSYQRCFCLCQGFQNPKIKLSLLGAQSAVVRINGQPLTTSANFTTPVPEITLAASILGTNLKPGDNCLAVAVQNQGHPGQKISTGFWLSGSLLIEGGACNSCAP